MFKSKVHALRRIVVQTATNELSNFKAHIVKNRSSLLDIKLPHSVQYLLLLSTGAPNTKILQNTTLFFNGVFLSAPWMVYRPPPDSYGLASVNDELQTITSSYDHCLFLTKCTTLNTEMSPNTLPTSITLTLVENNGAKTIYFPPEE